MRQLNTTEINAVSGGFFFKAACKPVATVCLNPLEYALNFIGGALKLLCTGEKSPTATICSPCQPCKPACGGDNGGGVIS